MFTVKYSLRKATITQNGKVYAEYPWFNVYLQLIDNGKIIHEWFCHMYEDHPSTFVAFTPYYFVEEPGPVIYYYDQRSNYGWKLVKSWLFRPERLPRESSQCRILLKMYIDSKINHST